MKPYKVLATLPPKGRSTAEKILFEIDGREVVAFRKTGKSETVNRKIKNQAESVDLINSIGAKSRPSFRAPKTYDAGPGYIATEWVDGKPISETVGVEELADTLAPMLYAFDKYGAKPDTPPSYSFSKTFSEAMEQWRVDVEERVVAGLLDEELFNRTIEVIQELYPKLTSCLQDADIKPAHLYHDPTKQADFVLIDSEHVRDNWPRYYDLGNLIAKYQVSHPLPAFNQKLLADFVRLSGVDLAELLDSLRATLLVRGLGFIRECSLPPSGDYQITQRRIATMLEKTLNADKVGDLL